LKSYLTQGVSFVQEAWAELAKVHYPSPKDTLQATVVVVILAFVIAVWLGVVDYFATMVVRELVS
jgi:preprotein translocase subunit SecE